MSETQHLLRGFHAKIISREELLKRLLSEAVVIIASYTADKEPIFNVQDFIRDGKSFIPLFSDIATGQRLTEGAKVEPGMGFVEIKTDYLAAMFTGAEWLVLNAGDETMIEMYAYELKSLLPSIQSPSPMETKAIESGGRTYVLTEPTQVRISKPTNPPSDLALTEMRQAVATTDVRLVYWFWISISGGASHLGLAIDPSNEAVMHQVGKAIEPIWLKQRTDNSLITLSPLCADGFLEIMKAQGQLLYSS